jgi:YD repeat-containing protein
LSPWDSTPSRYVVADFNGDGRADIAYIRFNVSEQAWLCLSKNDPAFANGFDTCVAFTDGGAWLLDPELPAPPLSRVFRPIADFNGDGSADFLVYRTDDSITGRFHVHLTGGGYGAGANLGPYASVNPYFGGWPGLSGLADSNGDPVDSYADFHSGSYGSISNHLSETCHSKGDGSFQCTSQTHPSEDLGAVLHVADYDGDGRPDAWHYSPRVSQLKPDGTRGPSTAWATAMGYMWGDFNGDGLPDAVGYIHSGPDAGRWVVYLTGFGGYAELLARVTDGHGHVTEVDYKSLHESGVYTPGADVAYPKRNQTQGPPVVAEVRRGAAALGWQRSTYAYKGLRTDQAGRGSLGFEQVTEIDTINAVRTVSTFSQDWPSTGMVASTRTTKCNPALTDCEGVQLSLASSTFAAVDTFPGAPVKCPYVNSSTSVRKDLDGSDLPTLTSTIPGGGIDAYCNVTSKTDTATEPGGGDVYTTVTATTYLNDAANWLIGLPTLSAVTKSAPGTTSVTRTVSMTYHPGTEDLHVETIEPNIAALRLTTTHVWWPAGVLRSRTQTWIDPLDGSTPVRELEHQTYDARFRYVTELRNALGHVTTRTNAEATGALLTQTDPNGLVTTWTYDAWGRKASEARPDLTKTTWDHRQCVHTCDNGATRVEITRHWATVSGADLQTLVPEEVFFDKLERKVLTRRWDASGAAVYADRIFETVKGRLDRVSRLHTQQQRDTGGRQWVFLGHDDLGRPLWVDEPGAGGQRLLSHIDYFGMTTVRKRPQRADLPQRQQRTEVVNALGKLESVTDEAGKVTTYAYEPWGNLRQTIDPLGNRITVLYDDRGRRKQLADPNLGTWLYVVDPPGRTRRQTDAKSQVTTNVYDLLDRLTSRVEPDLTSTWVFDTASMGIGQLAESYTGPVSAKEFRQTHAYDSAGRERSRKIALAGDWQYETETAFDSFGRPQTLTHHRGAIGHAPARAA